MTIAKLIDGPCKGQEVNLTIDSFPDTVRAYKFDKNPINFSASVTAMPDITVPIYVYHFKSLWNAGVAEYSIEEQKK